MSGGLIVAAPASGSGKTVITLALLRRLRRLGIRAAAAKSGPDYIDPGFHAAATEQPCLNLDVWAMRRESLAALVRTLEGDAEIVLCEGAMGLFDGAGIAGAGSTADLAALTGWPVVLVVNAEGQAGSIAALIEGFARHREDVTLAGVILNCIGGTRHKAMLEAALRRALPDLALLGAVPRAAPLTLPSRHLGLIQAREHRELEEFLDRAASIIAEHVDIARLMGLARAARCGEARPFAPLDPLGARIAVARDDAFAFAYPALLEAWRRKGAEISFFSPLGDEAPVPASDAVYLPGGYPELYAGRIAVSGRFFAGLRQAVARGALIYGECGGYMVLGARLVDGSGQAHAMAGLLPVATSFAARKIQLGYRAVRLAASGALGVAGQSFRGHEFHYATLLEEGDGTPLFSVGDADGTALGNAGRIKGKVMGSFIHLIDRCN